MWGIIHMIVELLMKHEDGKYVMMKVRVTICAQCCIVLLCILVCSFLTSKYTCVTREAFPRVFMRTIIDRRNDCGYPLSA